jgi:hypothetical protein
MQRLARRHVSFANLNLCVVNVRQNLADVAPNACPYARNQTPARRCRCAQTSSDLRVLHGFCTSVLNYSPNGQFVLPDPLILLRGLVLPDRI